MHNTESEAATTKIPEVLIGNAGADPWTGETKRGHAMAAFNFAARQGDKTIWYRLLSFGELADEVAMNIRKGNKLRVNVDPKSARRHQYRAQGNGKVYESVSLRMILPVLRHFNLCFKSRMLGQEIQ